MDDRMGHADGSVSARYAHVTSAMRQRLLTGLTGLGTTIGLRPHAIARRRVWLTVAVTASRSRVTDGRDESAILSA
jgi:hypothetical protein